MLQLPADEGEAPAGSEPPEEAMERLAHLEQLVVQLKELIRDKDTQLTQKDAELTNKDAQFKVKIQNVPRSWRNCLILLPVNSMRKRNLKLASPNSNCRPKPRWHHSTNRSLS